jgi:hypothetical protein
MLRHHKMVNSPRSLSQKLLSRKVEDQIQILTYINPKKQLVPYNSKSN